MNRRIVGNEEITRLRTHRRRAEYVVLYLTQRHRDSREMILLALKEIKASALSACSAVKRFGFHLRGHGVIDDFRLTIDY